MVQLIGGDVIRPGLAWLLTTPAPARFAVEMERIRDPEGMAALRDLASTAAVGKSTFDPVVEKIAVIMATRPATALQNHRAPQPHITASNTNARPLGTAPA